MSAMATNKKCFECGHNLAFDVEAAGRELSCLKCGAVYEYRNYFLLKDTDVKPKNLNETITLQNDTKPACSVTEPSIGDTKHRKKETKDKIKMSKKGTCVNCKREMTIVAFGLCWRCYYAKRKKRGGPGPQHKAHVPVHAAPEKTDYAVKIDEFVKDIKLGVINELLGILHEKAEELAKK